MLGTPFFFASCWCGECNPLRVSCAPNRSRCRAVSILVHLVANPQIWTPRHASGDMDHLAESQMWRDMDLAYRMDPLAGPEAWILYRILRHGFRRGSTPQAAETWNGHMDLAEDPGA